MTASYRITPRAEKDLFEIARYTQSEWGRTQRNRYLKALELRFKWLAENPQLGLPRSDIRQGYYCYPQGKHLIFYIPGSNGIDIIGVPHQRMDPGALFDLG